MFPRSFTKVKEGRTINFTVAGKDQDIQVPDVKNMTLRNAKLTFSNIGLSLDTIMYEYDNIISEGLIKLGIIKDSFENVIKNEMYKDFYMHKTGHWLGLDVHDVGEYENIKFKYDILKF